MSHQIWMNGDLVAHEDAKVHVLTHALHYGTSVFEGVRAYETPDGGSAVFRHQDHIDRLFRSAGLYHMEIPYSIEDLRRVRGLGRAKLERLRPYLTVGAAAPGPAAPAQEAAPAPDDVAPSTDDG